MTADAILPRLWVTVANQTPGKPEMQWRFEGLLQTMANLHQERRQQMTRMLLGYARVLVFLEWCGQPT